MAALADLDTRLAGLGSPAPRLRVTLCDPAAPGPGAVWDPEQPAHLRMNVDARIVDLSCPSVPDSYRAWEQRVRPGTAGETFPPRASVGRYLAWAYERLRSSPRLDLRHCEGRVTEVTRRGDYWHITAAAPEGSSVHRAPVVLLCTGHADSGGPDHRRIAAGDGADASSPLTVTGAALTAIDVVLDLTEGLGGDWRLTSAHEPEYVASGREPRLITLNSRTGEMMLPKPATDQSRAIDAVQQITSALPTAGEADDAWWMALAEGAVATARTEGVGLDRSALMHHLDHGSVTDPAEEQWARGLARAHGQLDGDLAWWWGRAWSGAYRDVVRSLERGERTPELWSRWRRRAARLEKWAFGPPPATVAKLLAFHRAGLLRVRTTPAGSETPAAAISAVTAGPGILTLPAGSIEPHVTHDELWASLLARGEVSVRPGERGVFTRSDGVCVTLTGRPSVGLAVLGRPTEDPVIGHDTLNRALHEDSGRWAQAVADWTTGGWTPVATLPFPDHERNSR